jgi:hypothetical protein
MQLLQLSTLSQPSETLACCEAPMAVRSTSWSSTDNACAARSDPSVATVSCVSPAAAGGAEGSVSLSCSDGGLGELARLALIARGNCRDR